MHYIIKIVGSVQFAFSYHTFFFFSFFIIFFFFPLQQRDTSKLSDFILIELAETSIHVLFHYKFF